MNATDNQAPDEIEELLPWHAAGTLSQREAERVERAQQPPLRLARGGDRGHAAFAVVDHVDLHTAVHRGAAEKGPS